MKYKLYSAQYRLLKEALRRHTMFNLNRYNKPLLEAWTGLGSYTTYKPALDADLMTYATKPNPGFITWFKLTEKGAAIVQFWLDSGFDYISMEKGISPPISND